MVTAGAIIQVRLGSERLPNKALLPLPFSGGPTLLEHVMQRASAAQGIAKVIIATTDQPVDDAIEVMCERRGFACYRGSATNVLERYVKTAQFYGIEAIIRLTGDNPFVSPKTISYTLQQHLVSGIDYTITEGLPLGTNIEVVALSALERAASEATEATDKEHVTPYVRREEGFKRQALQLESPLSMLRLTVDFPSDYALASLLYERLYQMKPAFDFTDIERLLGENPWLAAINSHHSQRKAFASEREEIQEAENMLEHGGFTRALQRLKETRK